MVKVKHRWLSNVARLSTDGQWLIANGLWLIADGIS